MKLIITYIFLGFTILFLFWYTRSELNFPIYPYIDTQFTQRFTWDSFSRIDVGMSQNKVVDILGEPLRKRVNKDTTPDECWEYSTDGNAYPYFDFSWYSVKVCFTNDFVSSKPVNEFND